MALVVFLRGVNAGGHRTFPTDQAGRGTEAPGGRQYWRGGHASTPMLFPSSGPWLMKILARRDRFVIGMYKRHMKVIGYVGALDRLYCVPVTTRSWNTIAAIARVLRNDLSD